MNCSSEDQPNNPLGTKVFQNKADISERATRRDDIIDEDYIPVLKIPLVYIPYRAAGLVFFSFDM